MANLMTPIDLLQNPLYQHKSMGRFGAGKGHYRYSVSSKVMEGVHVYIPIFHPVIQFIHDKSRQIICFLWLKLLISTIFEEKQKNRNTHRPFQKGRKHPQLQRCSDWPWMESWFLMNEIINVVESIFQSYIRFYHVLPSSSNLYTMTSQLKKWVPPILQPRSQSMALDISGTRPRSSSVLKSGTKRKVRFRSCLLTQMTVACRLAGQKKHIRKEPEGTGVLITAFSFWIDLRSWDLK